MHADTIFQKAISLLKSGKNPSEVARLIGISRTTIRDWNNLYVKENTPRKKSVVVYDRSGWAEVEFRAYAFILGVYLGDGYINKTKDLKNGSAVYQLRLFQDPKYIKDINEWQQKLQIIFPDNQVALSLDNNGTRYVRLYSKELPVLFP